MNLISYINYEKSKNIYFEKLGSGQDAIIFIHGLAASHRYWIPEYKKLAENYSLYFVDLLGFGFSQKPHTEYSLDRHVEAIKKFIDENVKEKNVYLVTHSLGAIIALGLLKENPNLISKAILTSLPYYKNKEDALSTLKKSRNFAFMVMESPISHLTCLTFCNLRRIIQHALFFNKTYLLRDAFLHTHNSYFSTYRNVLLAQDISGILNKIEKNKVIFIHGEEDSTSPFSNTTELSERFKIKLIKIKHGKHNFPVINPLETIALIKKLLNN